MKKVFSVLVGLCLGAFLLVTPLRAQAAGIVKTVQVGSSLYINLVSVDGTAPFTYQWQKNGVDIPGATGATLPFLKIALADVGTYTLKVMNPAGQAVSPTAQIFVSLNVPANVIIIFAAAPVTP